MVDSAFKAAMDRGIAFADEGKFDLALLEYEQARAIDKENGFLNYETALAHYQLDNRSIAIKYAKQAVEEKSQHGVQGCILLGTIWDERGKHKKAMRILERGVKRFGDYYLLNYNLGVAAFAAAQYNDASDAFEKAILKSLDHSQSHLGLARVSSARERMVEALFPLYFFMLLEPEHELVPRLVERISRFQDGLEQHLVVDKKDTKKKGYPIGDPMVTLDLHYRAFHQAKQLLASDTSVSAEIMLLATFFKAAGNIDLSRLDNLVSNYYVPFFAAIAEQGYMEACYHYSHHKTNENSAQWLKDNYQTVEAFFQWLDEAAPKPTTEYRVIEPH